MAENLAYDLKPICKRSNRNGVVTFESHSKTAIRVIVRGWLYIYFLLCILTVSKSILIFSVHVVVFSDFLFSDIDECDSLDRPCGSYNFLECVNNLGDYTCLCEYGFNFDKENRFCEGKRY